MRKRFGTIQGAYTESFRGTLAGKRQARANDYLLNALWDVRRLRLAQGRVREAQLLGRRMEAIRDCCTRSVILKCVADPTKTRPCAVHHCHQGGCSYCAAQRARNLVKGTEERIGKAEARIAAVPGKGRSIKFVTPTQKARRGESPRAARARLLDSLQRLRRTPEFKHYAFGGQVTFECTYNGEKDWYHMHAHVLLDCRYWPKQELQAVWKRVTGDSENIDIREATKGAVIEACKYSLKAVDLPPAQLVEYIESMKGVRMVSTFGEWYRKGENVEPSADEDVPKEFEVTDHRRLIAEELAGDPDAVKHLDAVLTYVRENAGVRDAERLLQMFDVIRHEMMHTHECLLSEARAGSRGPPGGRREKRERT